MKPGLEVFAGTRLKETLPNASTELIDVPDAKSWPCPSVPFSLKSKTLLPTLIVLPLMLRTPPRASAIEPPELLKSQPTVSKAYPAEGGATGVVWASIEPAPLANESNSEMRTRELETIEPRSVCVPLTPKVELEVARTT